MAIPAKLKTADGFARLAVTIGYSQEEIIEVLRSRFDLTEQAARDTLARTEEHTTSVA